MGWQDHLFDASDPYIDPATGILRNLVHPFREWNGRAQRLFWTLALRDAGWGIDWNRTSAEENDRASVICNRDRDYSALREMFQRTVSVKRLTRTEMRRIMERNPPDHLSR